MAKGKKSPTPRKSDVSIDGEVAKAVADLKNTGNKLFAEKDYGEAMKQYDAALSQLPDGASDRADLLCNKAACFYALNRYKDAVKECGNALDVNPSSAKALRHRARALEKQGLYKQALTDIQTINKTEAASDDSREAERRLKDLVAGRRPSLANGGARTAGPGGGAGVAAARGNRSPLNWPFTAKVTLGSETRLVQLTANSGYGDLLAQVSAKFPNAGPCVLKYVDKEGDLVTITSRSDVQAALAEALQGVDRRLGLIPPIKVTVTPASSQAEVPPVPLDELAETQLMIRQQQQQQQQALAAAAAAQQQQQPKQQAQTPSGEIIEIDDWLVDFVNLFRETTNVDADRHVESQNEGWQLTQRAMETTVRSAEALPIFDKAIDRFKEVIAAGYINWGNVFSLMGHKVLDEAAAAGTELDADLASKATAEFDKAEAKIKQAMEVKPGFFEVLLQLAALEFDRAKLAAKLQTKPVPTPDPAVVAADLEAANKAVQEAQTANTKEALAKIKAADVEAAKVHMDAANDLYKQAVAAAQLAEESRKAEAAAKQQKAANGDASAADAGTPEPSLPQQDMTISGHAQVMWGNNLYEWSQMLAAVGKTEWRTVLDEGVELFKKAGCSETDIRGALKNHSQVDQLDLGPDPEPEQPATPAAEPAAQQQQQQAQVQHKPVPPEAKGLPKLERKKAKE